MKLKIGSYIKFNDKLTTNPTEQAFGFVYEILNNDTEYKYKIRWIGNHEGITTGPGTERNYILLREPSKLTDLLFL